jgi:hypothetical protein
VLVAAELRALAAVDARLVRLEGEGRGRLAGNEIAFAVEGGDPEAVDDVRRTEVHGHGHADGDGQLVGGGDALALVGIVVLDLPPPLLAGDGDLDGAIGNGGDAARGEDGGGEEREEGEHGQAGGGDDGVAHARRGGVRDDLRAAAQERGDEEEHHQHPDHRGHAEEDVPQARDLLGLHAGRLERGLDAPHGTGAGSFSGSRSGSA